MVGLNEYEINKMLSQEAREAAYLTDSNMKRLAVAICKALAKTMAANNKKISNDMRIFLRKGK